jgi:uncharacterized protein YbjT (DUF2867 family)
MSERQKIAVAGATGRVGGHVVDVLDEAGHDVIRMSRSTHVDVITGEGLSEALAGVDCMSTPRPGRRPSRRPPRRSSRRRPATCRRPASAPA